MVASGIITDVPEQEVSYDSSWIFTDTGLQPLGSRSVFVSTDNRTVGDGTFSLIPTASYDTLNTGVTDENATNNLDLAQYNFNKVQNDTVNQVDKNLGALISASGKFGPEITSVWAAAGSQNAFNQVMQTTLSTLSNRNTFLPAAEENFLKTVFVQDVENGLHLFEDVWTAEDERQSVD